MKRRVQHAYFNRELSWLAFNRRVLEEAQNPSVPLLERVRFLSIVSSNLDEFFEIRVSGIIQQVDSGVTEESIDGLGAREQLRRIHLVVASLIEDQHRTWHRQLAPLLARQGIVFKTAGSLSPSEVNWAKTYFRDQVQPALTPFAVDAAHPFPLIGNKTLNIVVLLDNPDSQQPEGMIAVVPMPRILPRIVPVEAGRGGARRFIFLGEIIKLCVAELFPGYQIRRAHSFRVTRNSDLYIDEEEAANLLLRIEDELRNLRRGAAVRLEIEEGAPDALLARLCGHLSLPAEHAFRLPPPLNLLGLSALPGLLGRPDLEYRPLSPTPRPFPQGRVFDTIAAGDVLLHHPYDSFDPVVDFVSQAAADPRVFAIKQTLYRTSGDSPIVRALIEASRNGKQVTALVELKARFDEAANINWARQLEEAGVHVVYGIVGLKIHCKLSLVIRRESRGLRRYAHMASGNYNPGTARQYTDLSCFTARPAMTAEVADVFNSLTGLGRRPRFKHLLVAPYNLHARTLSLIRNEARSARLGRPARIIAKMNALVDKETIDALYEASRAGVQIDLIVRGTCCLVPGLPGLSENIRVRSIVGRFLEHARLFYFQNHGGPPRLYSGSADWMPRNFFRRVELLFPVLDPALRRRILGVILPAELRDNVQARVLQPGGAFLPVPRPAGKQPFSVQEFLVRGS